MSATNLTRKTGLYFRLATIFGSVIWAEKIIINNTDFKNKTFWDFINPVFDK